MKKLTILLFSIFISLSFYGTATAQIPPNATASSSYYVGWYCNSGYTKKGNKCVINVAQNSGAGYKVAKDAVLRKDYKTAYNECIYPAKKGDADCQNLIGILYNYGYGVTKNSKEALKWYTKSAEQGNWKAEANLGNFYANGVPKNYKEAVKWYTKAAEQGKADGLVYQNLGWMYHMGKGVLKDYKKAAKWNIKAAEKGQAWAQLSLAGQYINGWGVLKDIELGKYWLHKAYNNDIPEVSKKAEENWNILVTNNNKSNTNTNTNRNNSSNGMFGGTDGFIKFFQKPLAPPTIRTNCRMIGNTLNCTTQ